MYRFTAWDGNFRTRGMARAEGRTFWETTKKAAAIKEAKDWLAKNEPVSDDGYAVLQKKTAGGYSHGSVDWKSIDKKWVMSERTPDWFRSVVRTTIKQAKAAAEKGMPKAPKGKAWIAAIDSPQGRKLVDVAYGRGKAWFVWKAGDGGYLVTHAASGMRAVSGGTLHEAKHVAKALNSHASADRVAREISRGKADPDEAKKLGQFIKKHVDEASAAPAKKTASEIEKLSKELLSLADALDKVEPGSGANYRGIAMRGIRKRPSGSTLDWNLKKDLQKWIPAARLDLRVKSQKAKLNNPKPKKAKAKAYVRSLSKTSYDFRIYLPAKRRYAKRVDLGFAPSSPLANDLITTQSSEGAYSEAIRGTRGQRFEIHRFRGGKLDEKLIVWSKERGREPAPAKGTKKPKSAKPAKKATTTEKDALRLAELLSSMAPRIWSRGGRTRVYLRYPRGYRGGAGGGDNGFIDAASLRYVGRTEQDLLEQIKSAIESVRMAKTRARKKPAKRRCRPRQEGCHLVRGYWRKARTRKKRGTLRRAVIRKKAARPPREKIRGGRASGMSPRAFDRAQLRIGTEHELEHTTDRATAREIAMDHLAEDPNYYTRLAQLENQRAAERVENFFGRLARERIEQAGFVIAAGKPDERAREIIEQFVPGRLGDWRLNSLTVRPSSGRWPRKKKRRVVWVKDGKPFHSRRELQFTGRGDYNRATWGWLKGQVKKLEAKRKTRGYAPAALLYININAWDPDGKRLTISYREYSPEQLSEAKADAKALVDSGKANTAEVDGRFRWILQEQDYLVVTFGKYEVQS